MKLTIDKAEYHGSIPPVAGPSELEVTFKISWQNGDRNGATVEEYEQFNRIVSEIARGIQRNEEIEIIVHDTRLGLDDFLSDHRARADGEFGPNGRQFIR